ncbi:MAG: hypothetical protein H6590_00750 [Flavobacteriales bacterium]|nr:hypothetical protein [Flavobacteriales bacterium]
MAVLQEVKIADKAKYLTENFPFEEMPALTEQRRCIHCERIITVGDYKVFRDVGDGFEYICCPHAPDCDGTVIDWTSVEPG